MDGLIQLVNGMIPTIVSTLGLTKIVKGGVESGLAAASGAFNKLPASVTRLIAVLLAAVVKTIESGTVDASTITEGVVAGAIATGVAALVALLKPKRDAETPA